MFWKGFVAPSDSQEISMLLKAWGNGDQAALDRLTALVYAELHRMARRHMRTERENTLQTTALEIADGRIAAIYVMRNPDKLRHLGEALH